MPIRTGIPNWFCCGPAHGEQVHWLHARRANAAVCAAAAFRQKEELVSGLLQALAVRRYVG